MKLTYVLLSWLLGVMAEDIIPSVKELTNGNLLFSSKTYTALAKLNDNDFLVCPLSVSVVLALVEAGSGGKTSQQLLSGLNLPSTSDKTQEAYQAVTPSLNIEDQYTLTSANKVYLKDDFEINPRFKQVATGVFNAEVESIDFSKNTASVAQINKWVELKTKEKIKDIVAEEDIDKQTTRAVLVNALYFKGDWFSQFLVKNTREAPFYALGKNELTVQMMEQTGSFNYYEDAKLNAKFLQLDYRGGDISMTFVLPNDAEGLPALESNIADVLKTPAYNYERVHVQIPKVKIESTIKFIPILQQFGIEDVFGPQANLTGIEAHGQELYVSKVLQKTFIEIAEEGTTAAAATVAIIMVGSAPFRPKPPKEFLADHPFIFYIKYRYGILFVGRYVGNNKQG